ncbi:MAG: flagellar biosynthesis protein FlgI [Betaproteobacteria bacterium HGW-Betaproteobacteria-7]|nr:MAG: flagellar biosynthesis protein FlgI [Betaproteobacteria bacterium HGW-Betaproteobacteria-7]
MNTKSGKWYRQAAIIAACLLPLVSSPAFAERIKDLAAVQGVRHNQLIGYGIVVGLDNTGDQTTQTPFTSQAIGNMLSQMGVNLTQAQAEKLQLKNVAAVMVTASLPPFARPGQPIDITVSSMGNAKSLRGGTLVMTPLKGGDGQVYAMAQGNILVGGVGATSGNSKVTVNHLAAGRIPAGATVERAVPTTLGQGGYVYYELAETDFGNAQVVVDAINKSMGQGTAQALDGRRIAVRTPDDANARVAFLGRIDNLEVRRQAGAAKVVINPRTGSVVMNQRVSLEACTVAHGSLSVIVEGAQPQFGQPADIQVKQDGSSLIAVKAGASLAEVVKALNALGANPLDLLAILQAMKSAGALRADLEVI